MKHLEGRPVSMWTYSHHGCRCEGCRACAAAAQSRYRGRSQSSDDPAIAIEQRIARGWTTVRIMADLGVDYQAVHDVRRHLDAVAHDNDRVAS